MKLDPRKMLDVKLGMYVEIEDANSGKRVEGRISFVISQSDHPDGIFVKIDGKNKGHVKKLFMQQ